MQVLASHGRAVEVGVGEIPLGTVTGDLAACAHHHTVGKRLRDVRLVEPHHLDAAGRILEPGFCDGSAALPCLAGLGFTHRSVAGDVRTRSSSRNRAGRARCLVAGGEVIEEIAHRSQAELLKRLLLVGLETGEMLLDGVRGLHVSSVYRKGKGPAPESGAQSHSSRSLLSLSRPGSGAA